MHVVDVDENIDVIELKPSTRVALRRRSYTIHAILQKKIDPVVKLSKVQNNPECTYDMIGGLDEQIKEIKEVSFCTFLLSEFTIHCSCGFCDLDWFLLHYFFPFFCIHH